jgi:hypothetical protein
MTYRRIRLGRLSATILFATTVLCRHPHSVAAQDSKPKPASTDHADVSPSALPRKDEPLPVRQDLNRDSLPDAPLPTSQEQETAQSPATSSGTQPNQILALPPALTRNPLTGEDKFRIYIHKTFGPPALILPAVGAGFQMLNPPSHYPREWKDGSGAFGRTYGYKMADRTSRETAQFLTAFLLHEDPRYQRSTSTNAFRRTLHALAFTVFDKTNSGRNTLAVSNFASAAAGGSWAWASFRTATTI